MKNKSGRVGKRKIKFKNKNTLVCIDLFPYVFSIYCWSFPMNISNIFKLISSNFEVIALAGIGMRVNFRQLIRIGKKASLYAIAIALIQIVSAISLITVFL